MRRLLPLLLLLVACGDGGGPQDFFLLEGTWTGPYTNSASPLVTFTGTLSLLQDDQDVFGSFASSNGRQADVAGKFSDRRFTATLTYLDECGGTARAVADLSDTDRQLLGTYVSSDCAGTTNGEFALEKQD